MFLKTVRSQLLIPGPRTTSFGELPALPRGGRAKAAVLNHCVSPRSLAERFGSPTSSGTRLPAATFGGPANRIVSPPPVMSAPSVVVNVTLTGVPLANVFRPDTCQLSSIPLVHALFQRALTFGRSYV